LKGKLSDIGISGQEAQNILNIWKESTKSGYDNTGLTWDKER
jgi:hypothetical protein